MASENKSVNAAIPTSEDTPQTTTPINHNDIPRPRTGQKRKFVSKNKPNSNYPPKHGKFNSTNGKRTEAKFEKKSDSPVLSVFTLLSVFELHTAFMGVIEIARAFYNILHSRDSKMTNLFSIDDLTYTLLLSTYYRCAYVTNHSATKIIFGLSQLKSVVEGILLPDVLATFVETFGQVKLSDGSTIAPFFDSYDRMKRQPGFVDPKTILDRMGLQPIEPEWSLNAEPVLRYMQASTRALKNAMELRPVKYTELEGRPELLGNYRISEDGTYKVTALDKIDQKQAQLGAVCRFRTEHFNQFRVGIALQPRFGAPDIMPNMFLTNYIVTALRG